MPDTEGFGPAWTHHTHEFAAVTLFPHGISQLLACPATCVTCMYCKHVCKDTAFSTYTALCCELLCPVLKYLFQVLACRAVLRCASLFYTTGWALQTSWSWTP